MKTTPTKVKLPKAVPPVAKTPKAVPREAEPDRYILQLYVAGKLPKSVCAIINLKKICEEKLHGSYELEVIDLYQQPQLAKRDQIIALPTLIKRSPLPLRRIIGDMSNTERVLVALDLPDKT